MGEVDAEMRAKVVGLVTLLSMGALFLPTFSISNYITIMDRQHDQQTFLAVSTLKGLSVEPTGCPGSGRGQGPHPISSSEVCKLNILE